MGQVNRPNNEAKELIEVREDDRVVYVGLNRPDKKNALDLAMCEALHAVLDRFRNRPSILVLHSDVPGTFVSGADIAELLERDVDDAMLGINATLFEKLEAHRWPTIAAVDGWALGGGCELAMACDLRVATPASQWGQPELGLGILAGAGGNWRLAQLVGLSTARLMLYTGRRLDGRAAHEAGLVDELTGDRGDATAWAGEVAGQIAKQSWRALELTKLALRQHRPATTVFDMTAQAVLFEDEEKRRRMQGFLDRQAAKRSAKGGGN